MGGVAPGSPVSASNTNQAFVDANGDDTFVGVLTAANTASATGPQIDNIQREHNSIASFVGKAINSIKNALPSWINNDVGTSSDDLFARTDALTKKMNATLGHTHSGLSGDAPLLPSANVDNVPLIARIVRATDITSIGVGLSSIDVTSFVGAAVPSSGSTTKGWVVNAPYNKVIMRDDTGGEIVHSTGGEAVYGRLTYSASVWTLTFYYLSSGVETSYSFILTHPNVQWYVQVLVNPITDTGYTYDSGLFVPSENATADIVDATATTRGLVSASTQTFGGNKTFAGTISASNFSGTNTGDVTLTAVGSTPSSNGASLSGQALTLQPADASNPGVIANAAQDIPGIKTFKAGEVVEVLSRYKQSVDSTTTGTGATVTPAQVYVEFTNASLVSIAMIAATADAQVLIFTNKTTASISILNESGATAGQRIQTGTGADLSLADGASITLIYDTNTSRWRIVGGSGSGSGGISAWAAGTVYVVGNLVTYSKYIFTCLTNNTSGSTFEADVALGYWIPINKPQVNNNLILIGNNFEDGDVGGWVKFNSTIDSTSKFPNQASGSWTSANANLTVSATSSGPLDDTYSLSAAFSSASIAGDMIVSQVYNMIAQVRMMSVSFSYKCSVNPANGNFSGTSSSSFGVAVYDVTNSVWIPLTNGFGMIQSSGVGSFFAQFQTAYNQTQFRLAIYNANASSGAITMLYDDFFVGQTQFGGYGISSTDSVAYTPTFTGAGTPTGVDVKWSKRGEKAYIFGTFTVGTPTAAVTISLPPGMTIDSSKVSSTNYQTRGFGSFATVGAYTGTALAQGGLSTLTFGISGASPSSGSTPYVGWSTGEKFQFFAEVEILGWSSSSQVISQYDGRVVAASYWVSANFAASTTVPINFDSKENDSHSSVTTSATAWKFVAPTSSYYQISMVSAITTGSIDIFIYKNGSKYKYFGGASASPGASSVTTIFLNSNEYIDIRPAGSVTFDGGALNTTATVINITSCSGAQQILAGDKIEAAYYTSTNYAVTANQAINFDTKITDTTGSVTTGSANAWRFTAPAPGRYYYYVAITPNNGNITAYLYKNGSSLFTLFTSRTNGDTYNQSGAIDLNAGDYISFNIAQSLTVSGSGAPYLTYVSINQGN